MLSENGKKIHLTTWLIRETAITITMAAATHYHQHQVAVDNNVTDSRLNAFVYFALSSPFLYHILSYFSWKVIGATML